VSAPKPTPPIDRAALDKIIQRAAELQTGEREVGDNLSPEEVLALGREVGIPTKYLQQAMLEHRTTLPAAPEQSVLGKIVGPREVRAQRVVQGNPDDVVQSLIRWMDRNELMVVQRQQSGWASWEPLRGMQAAIRRGTASLDTSKPKFMLSRADLVTATATALESGYAHVQLTATIRQSRTAAIGGGVAGASLGAAGAIILGVMSPFWLVTVPPLLVGGAVGWWALRRHLPVSERVQLGLERALDFLERGGVKPAHEAVPRGTGLLDILANEVRKALTPGGHSRRGSDPPPPQPPKSGT
jgi:hypothetical protein